MKRETQINFGKAFAFGAMAAVLFGCGGGGGNGGGSSTAAGFPSGIYAYGSTATLYKMTDITGKGWATYNTAGSGSIAFDSKKRAYITGSNRIARLDSSNAQPVFYGSAGTGVGQFSNLIGDVEVGPDDKIYILDVFNKRVVRIDDMTGKNWTVLGLAGFCPGNEHVDRMALSKTGAIYITQSDESRVLKFDSIADFTADLYGHSGDGKGGFRRPYGICLDDAGRIYVTQMGDSDEQKLIRFDDMTGANWVEYGSKGSGPAHFNNPYDVAVDSANHIYINDSGNFRIVRLDGMGGQNWTTYGQSGSGVGGFSGSLLTVKVN